MKIKDLFDPIYGTNLELNKCKQTNDPDGINFVSRYSKNNGISARVKPIENKEPHPAGILTCAAGSSSVLSTFVQPKPFYTGRDVYVLIPKKDLTIQEKLFYCMCIKKNAYKYYFGRQANKTLKDIELPDEIPEWVYKTEIEPIKTNNITKEKPIDTSTWIEIKLSDLFEIERGHGPYINSLKEGATPYVTSINNNNGLTALVDYPPTHKGNTLSVNRDGSVAESFYQKKPFCSTEAVHVFNPKFPMNKYIGLFISTILRQEKYRYGYGRKWGLERMNNTIIKLPSTKEGNVNWEYIENYIKSLPFADKI